MLIHESTSLHDDFQVGLANISSIFLHPYDITFLNESKECRQKNKKILDYEIINGMELEICEKIIVKMMCNWKRRSEIH